MLTIDIFQFLIDVFYLNRSRRIVVYPFLNRVCMDDEIVRRHFPTKGNLNEINEEENLHVVLNLNENI